MGTESIEASFLSIFALISFFIFFIVSKYSHKIKGGVLLDEDFAGIFKLSKIKKFLEEIL